MAMARLRRRCYLLQALLAVQFAVSLQDTCLVASHARTSEGCGCAGGYLLRVAWFGRLGNNLLQLAHALHLAQETKAEVMIPHTDFLSRHNWDFSNERVERCQIAVSDEFFYSSICPRLLDKTVFPVAAKRNILKTHILPVFQVPLLHSRDTVVIHVRGGDVFSPTPPPTYTQPPVVFYHTVLQLPELARMKIVLCTEDFVNPVVKVLQRHYRKRMTVVTDLNESIGTVLGARHLILGQSSFSEMLGMMAPELESIYVPFCVGREDLYVDLRRQGWGLSGYCYEYSNYIAIDGWHNTPEQLQLMTNLTSDNVHSYPLSKQFA